MATVVVTIVKPVQPTYQPATSPTESLTTMPSAEQTTRPSEKAGAPTPSPVPLPGACVPRDGKSVTLSASDDAYVALNQPNEGFNNGAIFVDDFSKTSGLVKWELTKDICECVTIKKASLQLYLIGPTGGDGFVYAVNPSWDEDSITWKNAPESLGPPLQRIGSSASETWVNADVTR